MGNSLSREERRDDLFERALEVAPERRAAFVAEACADDPALHEELISLLDVHDAACDYFDSLSVAVVTPALLAMAHPTADAAASDMASALQSKLKDMY